MPVCPFLTEHTFFFNIYPFDCCVEEITQYFTTFHARLAVLSLLAASEFVSFNLLSSEVAPTIF